MTDLHPDEDLLLDLALSDVDQQRREALTGHLALCDPCRAEYAAIADSVDHVLAAAPVVDPPAGFSRSVLTAMGMTEPDRRASADDEAHLSALPRPTEVQRGGRHRPRILVSALAAAVAVLAGVVGGVAVMSAYRDPPAQVAADGPALLTRDGSRVGTVLETRYDGQPVLAVTLTAGTVGARYDCQLILADGSRQPAGSWVLRQPSGTTWLLDRPDAKVTGLELVTDTGKKWAIATL
jgi:anti-sigma factor RsiW